MQLFLYCKITVYMFRVSIAPIIRRNITNVKLTEVCKFHSFKRRSFVFCQQHTVTPDTLQADL